MMRIGNGMAVLGVGLLCSCADAGQVLNVDAGQVLRVSDLQSGVWDGESFSLNPSLVINLNDGGMLSAPGEIFGGWAGFNMFGATINVNAGGRMEGESNQTQSSSTILANSRVNLYDGGSIGNVLFRGNQSNYVNLYGGTSELVNVDTDGLVQVIGGHHAGVAGFAQNSGSMLRTVITGGTIGSLSLRGADTIELRGGAVESIGAVGRYLEIYGSELVVDGVEFDLAYGESVLVNGSGLRFDLLSGVLEDGSAFEFDQFRDDVFIGATTLVTFHQVPGPATVSVFGVMALMGRRRR